MLSSKQTEARWRSKRWILFKIENLEEEENLALIKLRIIVLLFLENSSFHKRNESDLQRDRKFKEEENLIKFIFTRIIAS